MVELLADVLERPALDPAELDKLRERGINFIRAAKDSDPAALMPVYANAFVFGEHPYGNPVSGDETTLSGITHDDVVGFYRQQFGGDRLILAVAGDFDADALQAELAAALRRLAHGRSTLVRGAGTRAGGRRPCPAREQARRYPDLFLDRQHRRGPRLSAAGSAWTW